jgi:1,2-diacylglycerol 3-beta-glucosyltransferase
LTNNERFTGAMIQLLTYFFWILFSLTALTTLYLLVFALAGYFYKSPRYQDIIPKKIRRMAVFIPGYKEDAVIVDSAKRALEQDYPTDCYEVIVIADSLRADTLAQLALLPVRTMVVNFEVSTKAKAINAVMNRLEDSYDAVVVLDADNVMAPDFLKLMNNAFDQGWQAIQGHRLAKNTNNSTAVLDAISEELNNHIVRKGHRALGLSSSVIGSGMAFEYDIFREEMAKIDAVSGFDKELQMAFIERGIQIEYVEEALCYDEKVQDPRVFESQRTRWIAAQFKYLRKDFLPAFAALSKGNVDYFEKAMQTLLLPKVMLLGVQVVGVMLALLTMNERLIALTVGQLGVLVFVFYMCTPRYLKQKLSVNDLMRVPGLLLRFLRALTNMGQAKKRFINTPHSASFESQN